MNSLARAVAFYLPQFHPIAENDLWWGKGFTEWTNAAKARPLYRGHYQPHIPADLGFYDLRLPESRAAQAALARSASIEGFCYYHYWFAGRRILERPFNEVLASGVPDFPFCLCWANETWSGIWHGEPARILIEQTYPGEDDHRTHFAFLLHAFRDERYMRVEGRPIFVIYKPEKLPDPVGTTRMWRRMAAAAGLPGLYLIGFCNAEAWKPPEHGFDAKLVAPQINARTWISRRRPLARLTQSLNVRRGLPEIHQYNSVMVPYSKILDREVRGNAANYIAHPCLIHSWDNTPRSGGNGVVITGTTPGRYRYHVREALASMAGQRQEHRLLFLKSWNEWAEGNHLEPDRRYGHAWLDALRAELHAGTA